MRNPESATTDLHRILVDDHQRMLRESALRARLRRRPLRRRDTPETPAA